MTSLPRILIRTTDSAPGSDGLTYTCWAVHGGNIEAVYNSFLAIWHGERPPEWFNTALATFIPKSTIAPHESEYRATPSRYRPLSLSNASQKLVAKALNKAIEDIACVTVSPLQRVFVKGRHILDNVFDMEAAIEKYLHTFGSDPGVFLFDVEAAFPSAAQEWIWMVLERMGLPDEVQQSVRALYADATVRIMLNGVLSAEFITASSGI